MTWIRLAEHTLLGGFLCLTVYTVFQLEPAKAATPPPKFEPPERMAAKDAAVTACLMEQNVPVEGFGLKVVCVKKDQISWVR